MRLYKISDLGKDPQRDTGERAAVVAPERFPDHQPTASRGLQLLPESAPHPPRRGHSPYPRLAPMR